MVVRKVVVMLGLAVSACCWAQDPSARCINEMQADPRSQALWSKYPFDPMKGQSLDVLSNPNKPNAAERAALSFVATEGERCFDLGADWRRANYPVEVISLLETYRVNALSSMADLYAGKITFGEMAKVRAKLASDLTNQVQAAIAKIKAAREAEEQQRRTAEQRAYSEAQARQQQEAIAEQQKDAARRQAVLQILSQAQQSSRISLPPSPVTTNCTAFGNSMNCTTR